MVLTPPVNNVDVTNEKYEIILACRKTVIKKIMNPRGLKVFK